MTGVGFAQPNPIAPPVAAEPMNVRASSVAADRVEMGDRVERQPPEHLGRAVTQPEGRAGVAELVDRQTDEQHDRDDDDGRDDALSVISIQAAPWRTGSRVS